MKGCEVVIARILVCKNMADCAFMTNENINDGKLEGIRSKLKQEKDEYLIAMVNNNLGSAFKLCGARETLIEIARDILRKRKG